MNYWLHRITGGDNAWPLSVELFKKGYISIGWSDFATEEYLSMIRSGMEGFDKAMDELKRKIGEEAEEKERYVAGLERSLDEVSALRETLAET